MELGRRHRSVQINEDQENVCAIKGKSNVAVPTKRQGQRHGLDVRGVLGEVSSNVQVQRDIISLGKVAFAAAEIEKKASLNRANSKSDYSHVRSKIDTGLARNIQPAARHPLRREESMASHAVRAIARTKAALKETQSKYKSNENIVKKDSKRSNKLPVPKEQARAQERNAVTKPVIKEQAENIEKLILDVSQVTVASTIAECETTHAAAKRELLELPDDIEDIDAGDNSSPLLMSVYINDIYSYLTDLEEKYPVERDHLRNQASITEKMRATLMDWLVEVQRQFSLLLETFQLTVGIIDRYLQAVPDVQRQQLQLVGVTAMFIASKYEEVYVPDLHDFVYVTDNAYTKEQVLRCERDIISRLGFCLARPIPLHFLRRFIKAAHGTSKNHHLAKYFVDLSLLDYSLTHYRPSELAAAAICLSLHLLSGKQLSDTWTRTLEHYSGYPLSHIEPIIRQQATLVANIGSSKYKAVYNKYSDSSLAKVALLPQLKGEALQKLVRIPSDLSGSE